VLSELQVGTKSALFQPVSPYGRRLPTLAWPVIFVDEHAFDLNEPLSQQRCRHAWDF